MYLPPTQGFLLAKKKKTRGPEAEALPKKKTLFY
jgi:hypothetical protein